MTTETIMLELPEKMYKRLHASARIMHRSIEEMLFQSIAGNLPPSIEDLPPDLQDEIGASLQNLDDHALFKIANAPISAAQWQHHQALLEKNQEQKLISEEAEALEQLRIETDKAVLRRSYAMALLKWRGFTTPMSDSIEQV